MEVKEKESTKSFKKGREREVEYNVDKLPAEKEESKKEEENEKEEEKENNKKNKYLYFFFLMKKKVIMKVITIPMQKR